MAPPGAGSASEDEVGRALQELRKYSQETNLAASVEEIVRGLLSARPANPRQWLLDTLEQELSNESADLSERDLHRLFAATRKINSEIMPQETIDIVISETLQLLNCDRVSLFVYDRKVQKLRLYASNLATPIMISPGQGIAGSVFNQKETVNIPDCYEDSRFDRSFDGASGYFTRSLVAVPILDFDGSSAGVIQAINKRNGQGEAGARSVPFGRNDEKILMHLSQHVCIAMRNAEVYREAIGAGERSNGLLQMIQSLSQDLGPQSLLLTVTTHATKVVSAERATVFLLDEEREQLWSLSTDTGAEIRIPMKAGIAGQCCCEGKVINIPDAYADSRFNQEVDKKTGFRTQSILAIPILEDQKGGQKAAKRKSSKAADLADLAEGDKEGGPSVIGVIQIINKKSFDGRLDAFDDADVEVMSLFATLVGPKLVPTTRRRPQDHKEADNAVGKSTPARGADEDGRGARKRVMSAALGALSEDQEQEEEEED